MTNSKNKILTKRKLKIFSMHTQSLCISKEYNFNDIELKWKNTWDKSMYYFDKNDEKKPQYIIDTPPPYPTGNFHIGNSLNWCYIDFIARYKRMQGFNVMFPQGWDCHGLPTEVKVEEIHNITKNQIPKAEFRKLCEELTIGNIDKMKQTMMDLGFSIDWSNEYVTMKPEYFVKIQKSFVRMFEDGKLYQAEHPVNWCPRCETAIAFAEIEYESRKSHLNFIYFNTEDGNEKLEIATTRPELLSACVAIAINPKDERYKNHIGKTARVPIFNHAVVIIGDDAVDRSFGTGVVMICTFGDKQDVRWWKEHNLPLRKAIDNKGIMKDIAGKYKGMASLECKKAIILDLESCGHLIKRESIDQNVGVCWRCKTPIEILSERQWFVKIDKKSILKATNDIEWTPDYMKTRLENWAEAMEWDWCISRQRIFATPIPIWYCKKCDKAIVAKEEWLPLNPMEDKPLDACACGSIDFEPEENVLDTWMDSSITALHVAGWPETVERIPTQLRPQGYDIIRTWAFYTILRSIALTDKKPWEAIVINGMVLGEDGNKMSKSLGNTIKPEEVIVKYGADSFRQWAAIGGSIGSDIAFNWKDVISSSRFLQKMWSIYRFSMSHLSEATEIKIEFENLKLIDKWILIKLNDFIKSITEDMNAHQFDKAFKSIRVFAWDVVADNYLEIVKSRLYGTDENAKKSAQYALFSVIDTLILTLAPFTPFFSEEMHSQMYGCESVHKRTWPVVNDAFFDDAILKEGELIKEIISAVRRYKSEQGNALNAPIERIEIYGELSDVVDIKGATNSNVVKVISDAPDFEYIPVRVKPDMSVIGPKYRGDAGKIVNALSKLSPIEISNEVERIGEIKLDIDSKEIIISGKILTIEKEMSLAGRKVDVLNVLNAIVVVFNH